MTTEQTTFERNTLGRRLGSMLKVDMRRMFTSRLFYIIVAACLVIPILILVMTTMMAGTTTVNPQTGVENPPMEAFDNVWQIIGSVSGGTSEGAPEAGMEMSLTTMCNIDLLYIGVAVLVCIFVAEDFRSGYAKNLFTVRAKKTDYVISKTLVCLLGGACMLVAFFLGSMLGGAIAKLPFTMEGFDIWNLVLCLLSKLFLMAVFVPIYLVAGVIAKQRTWLGLVLSGAVAMLLFMMISALTPLNASLITVVLCLGGGLLSGVGLGAVSNLILKKTSLV